MRSAHSPTSHRHDLAALKERLTVPAAWARLGLPGRPAPHCRSPFRSDRKPSFSIYDGGRRWHDHATGQGGDVIEFIGAACGVERPEATRRFLALVGADAAPRGLTGSTSKPATRPQSPALPLLHTPTPAELQAVADSRGLDVDAVALAVTWRTLVFGQVHGCDCWILTDHAKKIAEARRIDGLPFPPLGTLGERKAHTLAGSSKSWPVGVTMLKIQRGIRAVALVEGGPDYLAALHFALRGPGNVLPVAMLGRGTGARIDPQALELLRGWRVRIYPHADADGGGLTASKTWAAQLHAVGCAVDFSQISRRDGTPVKDLNDAALLTPDEADLEGLLP